MGIDIIEPSLCEHILAKPANQLLIRPFVLYEVPKQKNLKNPFVNDNKLDSIFKINIKINYLYKPKQKIKTSNSTNLISQSINLNFNILENVVLNQYIPAYLKYKNLQSCLLFELTQFIDAYTILGYLESLTMNALEIVKFRSKCSNKKQVFLISNNDCVIVKKKQKQSSITNELLIDNIKVNNIGKVLIDNNEVLVIQKGRPEM